MISSKEFTVRIESASFSDVVGTCYQGIIQISFDELVDRFGAPHTLDEEDSKVRCEWRLFINDEICTIYDWKDHRTVPGVTDWHIGGVRKMACINVLKALTYTNDLIEIDINS